MPTCLCELVNFEMGAKTTKQKRAREKLIKEISEQIHLFPEKYPYEKFALSQAAATEAAGNSEINAMNKLAKNIRMS